MPLDADTIVDRRRLRRKLTFWRVLAVVIAVVAVVGSPNRSRPRVAPATTTTAMIAINTATTRQNVIFRRMRRRSTM